MSVSRTDYDSLLADFTDRQGAVSLLRQHRPYLEKIPSLRRPEQSLITIPLPIVRLRHLPLNDLDQGGKQTTPLAKTVPCDLAILMCDPEWQIKLGAEILVFIHRPGENFSDLLTRWRRCQIYLDQGYEWVMPPQEQHMFSEGAEEICPLFILLEQAPAHIHKGLGGAGLPYIIYRGQTVSPGAEAELIAD